MNLLDGSFAEKNLQVGALSGQKIEVSVFSMSAAGLGLTVKTSYVVSQSKGASETAPATNSAFAKASFGYVKANVYSNTTASHVKGQWKASVNVYGSAVKMGSSFSDTTVKALKSFSKASASDVAKVLSVSSFENAGATMKLVQNAIDLVSTQRANLGAIQNRLEHTIANLDVTSENTSAAESRIRDTDMAKEMVTYSKNNILAQAGQSMLAQANQSTQGVLSLL